MSQEVSQSILDTFYKIETEMLQEISNSLFDHDWEYNPKERLLTDPLKWKLQKLDNLGLIRRKNMHKMLPLSKVPVSTESINADLNKMLIQSGLSSVELTDKEALEAMEKGADLLKPKDVNFNDTQMKKILEAHQRKIIQTLNHTNQTMIDESQQMYIDGVNEAAMNVNLGNKTPDQALRGVVNNWAEMGIPAMIDVAGRKWGVEGYLNTVMRTHNAQVAREMQQQRMEDYGIKHTEITKHPGDRPLCAPYAGRVFAIHPEDATEEYPWLDDPAQGEKGHPASLFGINCGHTQYSFIPGVSTQRHFPSEDPERDAEIYKESQRQRQLERSIRNAKTRKDLLHEAGDQVGVDRADKLIRARQKRMREFIDDTGRTRYYGNEGLYTKPSGFGSAMDDVKTYHDINDGHQQLERHEEFLSTLSSERDALHNYTMNSSGTNRALRNARGGKFKSSVAGLTYNHMQMQSAFDKAVKSGHTSLLQNTQVYRKVDVDDIGTIFGSSKAQRDMKDIIQATIKANGDEIAQSLAEELKNELVGGGFKDPAYFSTSRSEVGYKPTSPVQFNVKLPKGFDNGIFTEGASAHSSEREYLINTMQEWETTDVRVERDKLTTAFKIIVDIVPFK